VPSPREEGAFAVASAFRQMRRGGVGAFTTEVAPSLPIAAHRTSVAARPGVHVASSDLGRDPVGPHGVALTLPAFIQSLGWSAQPEDRNGPADWAAILYYLAFPLGLAGLWAVSRREGRSSFWRESPGKSAGGRPAAGRD